ncbi:MAG: transposase [Francisellaceae bacterium]
MIKKRTIYSAEFKTKVVLEALRDDLTLAQCASKHNVTTKNIQNWSDFSGECVCGDGAGKSG